MWYVYALKGKKLYVGMTCNLKRRILEHKHGKTRSTKGMGELKLIYYEAFLNKKDAHQQEKFYKSGYGREVLSAKLTNSVIDCVQSSEIV